ncbi:MAG: PQQ-binding-like beta-propeller repeat protein [Phycisphaerales bacterium]|nr:PQQ-binding-like beta-propeller repeat protein [Phycisphaerales bacterium]
MQNTERHSDELLWLKRWHNLNQRRQDWAVVLVLLASGNGQFAVGASEWTHFAGSAGRRAVSCAAAVRLEQPRWTLEPREDEWFVDNASPVAAFGRVYFNARVLDDGVVVANKIIALDAVTGGRLWEMPLDADVYDSWAAPAVDTRNKSVLLASGQEILAADAITGDVLWRLPLDRFFVNATAAVSADLGAQKNANRAFIADFAPGGGAQLYAINIDPYDAADNPFEPGQIAWQAGIGRAGGSVAAYRDGRVICVTRDGRLYSFDAATGQQQFMIPATSQPFFGGVTLIGNSAYAATYVFSGGQSNSLLVKFDLAAQQVVWTMACERTNSIPVVADDGVVFLSGGINGYGSTPRVQAFQDHGTTASRLWDTFTDSAGKLNLGGWTLQPVLAGDRLIVGVPQASGDFSPYLEIVVLNRSLTPGQNGFVAGSASGAGASSAVAQGIAFSHGAIGLSAFDLFASGDVNCDGFLNNFDIDPFVLTLTSPETYASLYPNCDVHFADTNGDGEVNNFDIDAFVALLTGNE